MDPISFTASIITVVATAAQVAKHLDDLRGGLQHAPDVLSSLVNEISDLRIVLEACDAAVNELCAASEKQDPITPLADAAQILDRTKEYLNELDMLISSCLGDHHDATSISKTARFRWLRVRTKVEKIQQRLRDSKQDLMVLMESQSVSALSGMQITVQDVSVGLGQHHSASMEKMDDILAQLSDHMAQTQMLRTMTEDLSDRFASLSFSRSNSDPSISPPAYYEQDPGHASPTTPGKANFVQVRAACYRKTCRPWCSCRCHIRRGVRTPGLGKKFFGSLFVGYSGIPVMTEPCNERQCKKRSSSRVIVSYQFPDWFWSRSLLLSFMTANIAGPELLIRIANTIPYASETYQFCLNGNVPGLLRLFEKRIASPFDLDPEGVSLLSNALRLDHFDACRLLISEGADLYQEDHTGFSPYHYAWDGILYDPLEPRLSKKKQALLELFPSDEGGLDERQFSRIHKSVLGIIGTKIEDELQISTSAIDDVDNLGRTALYWASRRSDVKAVRLLLEYGARCEPTGVRKGGSPLLAAAEAGNADIVRLLLENKANLRTRNESYQTPLHRASAVPFGTECVKLLLQAGANVNCGDSENRTSFHYASQNGCMETAKILLAAGADINALCEDGWAPIACCIFWNMHESIEMLLEAGADTLIKTEPGESLLHLAARYADETTLEILACHRLGPLEVTAKTLAGEGVYRIAEDREETPAWHTAFEHLLASIRAGTKERNVAEKGISQNPAISMKSIGRIGTSSEKDVVVTIEELSDGSSECDEFEDAVEGFVS